MAFAVLVTVFFMNGEALGLLRIPGEEKAVNKDSLHFSANDLDARWDTSRATVVTLDGTEADISGDGVYVLDGDVVFAKSGYYRVTGQYTGGRLVVRAKNTAKLWIMLDGVDLRVKEGSAIWVEKAYKVFLTLPDGTENYLENGAAEASDHTSRLGLLGDGAVSAVIYSREDLTINGSGSLKLEANAGHGIKGKDDLVIANSSLAIRAEKDGINVNDRIQLTGVTLDITSGGDGIDQDNEGGYFYLESGALAIDAGDDAINAEGDITVMDGELALTAGDDGLHAENHLTVNGGDIQIENCFEGLEACQITLNGGNIAIYPVDDGLNAVEPLSAETAEALGSETAVARKDSSSIVITGGSLSVINKIGRSADGLDSNGDIRISGGTVMISLANYGSNNAIDYGLENGGVCEITGGNVIACGSYTKAEKVAATGQGSYFYTNFAGVKKKSLVIVKDMAGHMVKSWFVPCSFSSMFFTAPELQNGVSYVLEVDGQEQEITCD